MQNKKRAFVRVLPIVFSYLVGLNSEAAQMVSSCYMTDNDNSIKGENINIRYPLASVAKVFTSLFVATKFSLEHKFITQVYATPVGNNEYDVHIKGSYDPYFNKYKMQMIISRLNEAGVMNIRNLTFDENVKYIHETDVARGFRLNDGTYNKKTKKRNSGTLIEPLILKAELDFPKKDLVRKQLQENDVILKDYRSSVSLALSEDQRLFSRPVYRPKNVSFLSSRLFSPLANSIKIYVASQDLQTMIKSMNWNSNNFAANRLMVAAGGLDEFHDFYVKKFRIKPSEIRFVNGSGQNHNTFHPPVENTSPECIAQKYSPVLVKDTNKCKPVKLGRVYNEATCSLVLRTVKALKQVTEKQNKNIYDVMAVMGADVGSTVGGSAYTHPVTNNKAVAKTGTVGTHVALAGMINGLTTPVYFSYIVAVNGTPADSNKARRMINDKVIALARSFNATKFEYIKDNPLRDYFENYDENTPSEVLDYIRVTENNSSSSSRSTKSSQEQTSSKAAPKAQLEKQLQPKPNEVPKVRVSSSNAVNIHQILKDGFAGVQ